MVDSMLNHGTSTAYNSGCRCTECNAYHQQCNRNWRANKREAQRLYAILGGRSNVWSVVDIDDQVGTSWMADGSCRGHNTDWWFEGKPTDKTWRKAMEICADCPVRTTCLEWAMQWPVHDLHGIWGGTSQRERARIKQGAPTWQPTPITLRTTGRISGVSLNNKSN